MFGGKTKTKTITVSYDNQLSIECANTLSGTSATVVARYNGTVVSPTWSITSGGTNATIAQDGTLTILNSGNITIEATYNSYTATKDVAVEYVNNMSSQTIVNNDGSVTTETQVIVENQDGTTTTTTTSNTTNEDGSFSQTEIETNTNQDGSSSSTSTTTNSDGTSSQSTSTTSAPNQSGAVVSETSTTYYDENGT